MKIYNPAEIRFVNKAENLDPEKQILCIRTEQNDSFTVSGVTDAAFLTDTVTVRTLHTGELDIALKDQSGKETVFSHVRDGAVLTLPDGAKFDLMNSFPL